MSSLSSVEDLIHCPGCLCGVRFTESRIGWFDNGELQVGVKCLLKMAENRCYHAHIQEMAPNKGPVIVFVEEIGEK